MLLCRVVQAVDAVNSEGNSALHWAALNGHVAVRSGCDWPHAFGVTAENVGKSWIPLTAHVDVRQGTLKSASIGICARDHAARLMAGG